MKLIISSVSGEPIYEQIKTQIRSAVLGGELKAGEALPSLRKLAKELRISVLTVTRAYNELADEGVVPEQCTVFEDLLVAMRSAKSVGMRVWAIHDESSDGDWPDICGLADGVLFDFSEAPRSL